MLVRARDEIETSSGAVAYMRTGFPNSGRTRRHKAHSVRRWPAVWIETGTNRAGIWVPFARFLFPRPPRAVTDLSFRIILDDGSYFSFHLPLDVDVCYTYFLISLGWFFFSPVIIVIE